MPTIENPLGPGGSGGSYRRALVSGSNFPALEKGRRILDVITQRQIVAEAIQAGRRVALSLAAFQGLAAKAYGEGNTIEDNYRLAQAAYARYAERVRAEVAGHLAIQFRSGVVALYTSPALDASDYLEFTNSGSKGKWCWARGLAAPAHPSYAKIAPSPEKILHFQPVASSWCSAAYLLAD
jgi:hypothetical protein